MTPREAIMFAIDRLNNEVERDFDGANVSEEESEQYFDALATLRYLVNHGLETTVYIP